MSPKKFGNQMDNDEYRRLLLIKLNALIGVLSVAITKIEKEMTKKPSDRLAKIIERLDATRQTCYAARKKLSTKVDKKPKLSNEISSISEYQKFQNLPPITKQDIAEVDLMDLCDKLQEDDA
jgi:uncharacterized small protein (DUF1192 family)